MATEYDFLALQRTLQFVSDPKIPLSDVFNELKQSFDDIECRRLIKEGLITIWHKYDTQAAFQCIASKETINSSSNSNQSVKS